MVDENFWFGKVKIDIFMIDVQLRKTDTAVQNKFITDFNRSSRITVYVYLHQLIWYIELNDKVRGIQRYDPYNVIVVIERLMARYKW